MSPQFNALALMVSTNPPGIAEAVTPEIQALADGMQDDPLKIYKYVHDHIKYVVYFGSKKGAELTLLEKSGNDFDQSALLVALLRAAGYNATTQFGWMGIPYDATNGTHNDLHHWLQLNFSNSNWNNTSNYLFNLFWNTRGYPTVDYLTDGNTFQFQRVWVTMTIGSTTYYLDPAFKVSEPVSGINLYSAIGEPATPLETAAAGTDTGDYVTGLNEAAVRGALNSYTTNFSAYLQNNYPNASMEQIMGGWQIVPATNTTLPTNLLFNTYTANDPGVEVLPIVNWVNEPTNLMATLKVTFSGTSYQCFLPQLEGQRLSLTFSNNGLAQLWLDDTMLAQHSTGGSSSRTNVVLYVNQPFGDWNFVSNSLIPDTFGDLNVTNSYQRTNATYALTYAFEPDWGWLQERQNKLDAYRQAGLADTSRQVVGETLNIMGLNWMLQSENTGHLIEQEMGILPQFHCRLGRMAQEAGHGYYVDVYMQLAGFAPNLSSGVWDAGWEQIDFDLFSYFGSSLENGIIEQLQNTNIVGASTMKMLEIANTNGQAVYMAGGTNWSMVESALTNYSAATETSLGNLISQGYYLLLPQNGSNHVAGAGSWAGYGYVAHLNTTNSQAETACTISGGYNGGYSSDPAATANTPVVAQNGDNQPAYFASAPTATPNLTGADPVDMADATFQVEHTDLSLGQGEPRGITLSRYYNGTRRYSNPAGMGSGWIHNYVINANTVAAPQAGLGGSTPAQAAAMIVATFSAFSGYTPGNFLGEGHPDPKDWMITAFIAKWGIDQLTKNGVSINLGKDSLQFVQQPNGVFTPPANCTMTLIQTNGTYWLQERHGNTFKFNPLGYMTNIVDQYNQSLKVAYNASNWVSTITDWKNRVFTFNYSGNKLTSISDGIRTVSYNVSSQNDLLSFTDPESKTSSYLYDTNHQITATFDALNRLVVSNLFDVLGHVTTQYTQGDPSKMWRIFWSGWQTIEQDPAGSQRIFPYDDQTRLIGQQDALGNLTKIFYDGQNHIVMTVSPLNETNQFIFDGNNNLIYSIDPLGFTNQVIFDSLNNPIRSIDPRGNPSTFGFNAQFTLIGSTNGAGDFVNYTVNTDGTPASRTDSGGTTTFGQDSFGQLNLVTYPNGDHENFANSVFGDVTNHTDARGFSTAFQFNLRRELTNTIAPTNVTASVAYDPADNIANATDPRGNTTSNLWSATRHLLATFPPPTAAGVPVITNNYDNREWLTATIDPLQHTTAFAHDLAGNVLTATDPLSRTTAMGYDADDRNIAATNAAGEVTRRLLDKRGGLVQSVDGAGHSVLRAFDGANNQIILTNRNGKKWQFQFDGANRQTNMITPLGRSFAQSWNHQNLQASKKSPSGHTESFLYNSRNWLTNRADSVGVTTYQPDANGNVTNEFENGLTNSWTVDAYNRPSSYRDVYGDLIQYRRAADGTVTNLIYPGNRNVYYTLDSHNQVIGVKDWTGRQTIIARDLNEHVTSITRPNGTKRLIGYDPAEQATNILEETAIGFPIALFRLNWNNAAEAQWEFAAPLPHTNAPPSRTMTYDDDNELATVDGNSVTLDSDGNLTSGPLTNDTFASYVFDARNRLLNAGGVTNAYDAMNNRIGQTYGTNSVAYVVDPNWQLPRTLMRIKNGVTNYYIYGGGLLYQITETATSTNALYYHPDSRGSTIALTDDNGNVTDRMEYSLYATLTYRTGTSDTPFLFNGRYGVMTDLNGLLYMRARYYNAFLCRFINSDPSGFAGGLNFYAYADGNPVSYRDPTGLGAVGDNQSLSWLITGATSDGTLFGGNSSSYEAASTTLNIAGIAQFGAEYGSGEAVLGLYNSSAASSGLYFNSSFWGGNQYVNTMRISTIAKGFGPILLGATALNDVYGVANNQVSPLEAGRDIDAGVIGLLGGPPGAVIGTSYGLFHDDINGAAAGSFQILTDWYYNAPLGPNFADLPEDP
jgi:RHS repeat-associated protein